MIVVGILLTITMGLLWSGVGVLFSFMARKRINFFSLSWVTLLFSTIISGAFWTNWEVVFTQPIPRFGELFVVVLIFAVFGNMGGFSVQKAMRSGHHGVSWAIGQSAMILPFISATIIWAEPLEITRIVGICAVIAGVIFLGLSKSEGKTEHRTENNANWIVFAFLAFFLWGSQQTASHIPSHWENWTDMGNLRVPLTSFLGFLLHSSIMMITRTAFPRRREFVLGAIWSTLALGSQTIMWYTLDIMAKVQLSAIVFPLAIGMNITSFTIFSMVFLKEPFKPKNVLGIIGILLGMALLPLMGIINQ